MAIIDTIVKAVKDYGASDLHLTTGSPPVLRVDGEIHLLKHETLALHRHQKVRETIIWNRTTP